MLPPPRSTSALSSAGRNARTVSFLQTEDADQYPVIPLMSLLCLIGALEGADAALFPASTQALVTEGFIIDNQAVLATAQSMFQAVAGPAWGMVVSRGIWTRRKVLTVGTVLQGAATCGMILSINVWWMALMRAVNGVMLAALRPIANSIVGDRFNDEVRGKYFGYIMSCLHLGNAITMFAATSISNQTFFGIPNSGWRLSFLTVGSLTVLLGFLIWFKLEAPAVKVNGKSTGIMGELRTLWKLMKRWTFAGLVIQGMFGLMPWKAFDYRVIFFQLNGLTDTESGFASSVAGFASAAGATAGGVIGDTLTKICGLHGRIIAAELSVYGGIPIAYFTFMVSPFGGSPTTYYTTLVILLGLWATWPSASTNSPILCSLADESERSLVLAWQTSLESAVGALGPLFVAILLRAFGVPPECLAKDADPVACEGTGQKAGQALFWTSCVPWLFCGLVYTTLHFSYPRDLEATMVDRERKEETEMNFRNNQY